MSDTASYVLAFLGGCVLGTLIVLFAWSVTNAVYEPSYGVVDQ